LKVKRYIIDTLKKHKLHMTLIDPAKQSPSVAADIAVKAGRAGTDAVMVGGSTGVTQANLDDTVDSIKKACKLPVIYFPSGANVIAHRSDAIYFMSMLNSKNVKNVTGEHWKGAPVIKKLGLEPISMGYIIVEPGMKVGEVGEADLISRTDVARAVGYGLSAEFFGMDLFYLEAGSGAPEPVPSEMIRAVRQSVKMPVIVGGGINTPEKATRVAEAGADIVVTGTIVENGDFVKKLRGVIEAVHNAK
jgi:phosphoglycerol geranylgeranyltransferase